MDQYRKYLGKKFFAIPSLTFIHTDDKCKSTSAHIKGNIREVTVKKIEISESEVVFLCKTKGDSDRSETARVREDMLFETPGEAEINFYDNQILNAEKYINEIKELKMKTVVDVKR